MAANNNAFNYVNDEHHDSLVCPICLEPASLPTLVHGGCGRMFCCSCLEQLRNDACSICRRPLDGDLVPPQAPIIRMLGDLRVRCPGNAEHIVTRSELNDHLRGCPDARVSCTAAAIGCGYQCARRDLVAHTAACVLAQVLPAFELVRAEHVVQTANIRAEYAALEARLAAEVAAREALQRQLVHMEGRLSFCLERIPDVYIAAATQSAQVVATRDTVRNNVGQNFHVDVRFAPTLSMDDVTYAKFAFRAGANYWHLLGISHGHVAGREYSDANQVALTCRAHDGRVRGAAASNAARLPSAGAESVYVVKFDGPRREVSWRHPASGWVHTEGNLEVVDDWYFIANLHDAGQVIQVLPVDARDAF